MKPLFDTREALAPVGTKDWAVFCRNKMQVSVDRDRQSEDQFNDYWSEFLENRGWEPLGFKDYREFAMSKRPDGLAMTQRQFLILCEHAVASDADKIASAKEKPLAVAGAPEGNKNAIKDRIAAAKTEPLTCVGTENKPNNVRIDYGNDTSYTLRRLARDNPEMLDRIESGELSVNAAAIAAGIRKKATSAEVCVKAFYKTEDRLPVVSEIVKSLAPHERAWLIDLLSQLKEPTQ
jgi:hypothetical protein